MFNQSESALAGIPRATLQVWVATAQGALAQLAGGAKVVSAGYAQGDGSRNVTYTPASIADLTNWIYLLNTALGVSCRVRRPMRPFFR